MKPLGPQWERKTWISSEWHWYSTTIFSLLRPSSTLHSHDFREMKSTITYRIKGIKVDCRWLEYQKFSPKLHVNHHVHLHFKESASGWVRRSKRSGSCKFWNACKHINHAILFRLLNYTPSSSPVRLFGQYNSKSGKWRPVSDHRTCTIWRTSVKK